MLSQNAPCKFSLDFPIPIHTFLDVSISVSGEDIVHGPDIVSEGSTVNITCKVTNTERSITDLQFWLENGNQTLRYIDKVSPNAYIIADNQSAVLQVDNVSGIGSYHFYYCGFDITNPDLIDVIRLQVGSKCYQILRASGLGRSIRYTVFAIRYTICSLLQTTFK